MTRSAARILVLIAGLLAPGCYTTHAPLDAEPAPDAGPCQPPPRGVLTVRAELLSAEPADCARVGAVFTRTIDLSGPVLDADCADGTSVLTPTADGCGLTIDAECFGIELAREFDGTLYGPHATGTVQVDQRFGFAFAPCDRLERWSIAE